MRSITKYLLIGGAAYVAYLLFKKKSAIDNLKFDIVSISASGITSSPVVDLNVRIRNVTAENINVNSIAGQLSLNGSYIGDAVATLSQQIPAYADTIAPIKVHLYNTGLLNSVLSFIGNFSAPAANFNFIGNVDFAGAKFPLSLTYKLI